MTQKGKNDKWKFYQDALREWRWTRTCSNGKIVGASSQGYKRKGDMMENAERMGYSIVYERGEG